MEGIFYYMLSYFILFILALPKWILNMQCYGMAQDAPPDYWPKYRPT